MNTPSYQPPTAACTDFRLIAEDGSVLITRSMEFGEDMVTELVSSQRGRKFAFPSPTAPNNISWTAKYGYVFANSLHVDAVVDGMNEVGLSFEYLFFPDEADFEVVPKNSSKGTLPYIHLGDWILSNFKTVDDVKTALTEIHVTKQDIPGLGKQFFPLHAAVFDQSGKGIVIEYIKGVLHIHDNQVGVMTNSPTFDWHITNLRNYINLTPHLPKPVEVGGLRFCVTGQGSGLVGLPGDPSPPSRFVKTCFLVATALPTKNIEESLVLAQHIINNVDIPRGFCRDTVENATVYDYTQWVVFKDITHRQFYYRTYNSMTLRKIDLTKVDFSETAKRLRMPFSNDLFVQDDTSLFLR